MWRGARTQWVSALRPWFVQPLPQPSDGVAVGLEFSQAVGESTGHDTITGVGVMQGQGGQAFTMVGVALENAFQPAACLSGLTELVQGHGQDMAEAGLVRGQFGGPFQGCDSIGQALLTHQ